MSPATSEAGATKEHGKAGSKGPIPCVSLPGKYPVCATDLLCMYRHDGNLARFTAIGNGLAKLVSIPWSRRERAPNAKEGGCLEGQVEGPKDKKQGP